MSLQPRPVRPSAPSAAHRPAPPRRVAVKSYRVHYRYNGMRGAWSLGACDKTSAILSMKELLPGCVVTAVLNDNDDW